MVTYGFYDSLNHDRRYNAIQFGSIFDGIIGDGIFMSIGDCFRVTPGEGMMLLVADGRAWFDHTWTLNDAVLPVYLPQSEVLLDRIDAVVLDINSATERRENSIIVVKGTPSKTPQRPSLIKVTNHHQYPLAYISVRAGVTSIRAADITSMIGTSATPYVTGILKTVSIDALLDQWRDQWQEFFEKQTTDMEETNTFWKQEWDRWFVAQTNEIQESYLAWQQEWTLWSNNYKTMMNDTAEEWKSLWNAWFYSYVNQNEQMISEWQQGWDTTVKDWFDNLNVMLDGDVAANLAQKILELEKKATECEEFRNALLSKQEMYDIIYDTRYDKMLGHITNQDNIELTNDQGEMFDIAGEVSEPILDNETNPLKGTLKIAIL